MVSDRELMESGNCHEMILIMLWDSYSPWRCLKYVWYLSMALNLEHMPQYVVAIEKTPLYYNMFFFLCVAFITVK